MINQSRSDLAHYKSGMLALRSHLTKILQEPTLFERLIQSNLEILRCIAPALSGGFCDEFLNFFQVFAEILYNKTLSVINFAIAHKLTLTARSG